MWTTLEEFRVDKGDSRTDFLVNRGDSVIDFGLFLIVSKMIVMN